MELLYCYVWSLCFSSNDAFGLKYEIFYNVAPSQLIPVKTKDNTKLMKWSYSPPWKKVMKLINC